MSSSSRSTGACAASGPVRRASCTRSPLVVHGFARTSDDSVGRRRRRTRYTITAKDRRSLAAWLSEPGEAPVLECEQLAKIHFADSGTKADVLANLEATRAWVLEQNEENLAAARAYLEGRGEFPERAALNRLPGRFLTEYYAMVARWVQWAGQLAETWPDDVTEARVDVAAAEEAVRPSDHLDHLGVTHEATDAPTEPRP
jgi:PadR family transcriptional regulator, regulatory protein AphA